MAPRGDATLTTMSVYVDHAFAVGDWGRWSGGGHMQADALDELRAGLRLESGEAGPDTEVRAEAEGEVGGTLAREVQPVRIRVVGRIAVRRAENDQRLLSFCHLDPAEVHVDGGDARGDLDWGVEAQELVHRS